MKVNQEYGPELADLFEKYEFNSLNRFIGHVGAAEKKPDAELPEIAKVRPTEAVKAAVKAGMCSVITEGADGGIFTKTRRIIVGARSGKRIVAAEGGVQEFKALLENDAVAKCGDDLKRQMNILAAGGVYKARERIHRGMLIHDY